jgi:predicted permease
MRAGILRYPVFTCAAVASVAIGIFATASTLTLADALLWRPLGIDEPDRIVSVAGRDAQGRTFRVPVGVLDPLRQSPAFEGVCGFNTPSTAVRAGGAMGLRATLAVTHGCVETLRLRAVIGRVPTADELARGEPVTMLTYETWQRDFDGRPDVLGAHVDINGVAFTVIGVTERRFSGVLLGFPPVALFPVNALPQSLDHTRTWFLVFARMPAGTDIGHVRAHLQSWPTLLEAGVPAELTGEQRRTYLASHVDVTPAATGIDYMFRGRFERVLVAVVMLGGVVLLASLVNLVHLLLARLAQRRAELTVRLALGATSRHLARETLAEGVIVLTVGGALGIVLAVAMNQWLVALYAGLYSGFAVRVTPGASTWWMVVALVFAVQGIFAAVQALAIRRVSLTALSSASARMTSHPGGLRRGLVAAQVALSLALLAVGSFAVETLARLRSMPLGWDAERVLGGHLAPLPVGRDDDAALGPYYRTLLDDLAAVPGVVSVAMTRHSPLFSPGHLEPVSVADDSQSSVVAEQHIVSDGFFESLGIGLVSGRTFSRAEEAARHAVISRSLARQLFGADDPIGRGIRVANVAEAEPLEVIGVVLDAILLQPKAARTAAVYRSFWQVPPALQVSSDLLVKTAGDPTAAPAIRRVVDGHGREFVDRLWPMSDRRNHALAEERLLAWLAGAFAVAGLAIASLGLFGLLSHVVAARHREMGLRIALGASFGRIAALVLREATLMAGAGVLIGVPLALYASRVAASRLASASPSPMAFVLAGAMVLGAVLLAAALLPTIRATRADPARLLRE